MAEERKPGDVPKGLSTEEMELFVDTKKHIDIKWRLGAAYLTVTDVVCDTGGDPVWVKDLLSDMAVFGRGVFKAYNNRSDMLVRA